LSSCSPVPPSRRGCAAQRPTSTDSFLDQNRIAVRLRNLGRHVTETSVLEKVGERQERHKRLVDKAVKINKEGRMSILRREIELAVQVGDEPTEMSAVEIIAWQPGIEVLAMRSYCGPDGVVLLLVTTNSRKASQV